MRVEHKTLKQLRNALNQLIVLPNVITYAQVVSWYPAYLGMLGRILKEHMYQVFAMGQASGDVLVGELHKRFSHQLTDWQPSFLLADDDYFKPLEAMKALEAKELILAGNWESDVTSQVKNVLMMQLQGMDRREAERSIATILNSNLSRAELILTTETTYAYNRGRLSAFRAGNVDYVRFSAVMDARTSAVCSSRHGLIMSMDSPELSSNTPPLHGRCRSILTPILSAYQSELITPEALNWSNVKAIPKGWRTDGAVRKSESELGSVSQAKRRSEKVMITNQAIEKVPLVKIPGFTEAQNLMLQRKHKELLSFAKEKNFSNEVLNIARLNFREEVITLGDERKVNPSMNPAAVALVRNSELNTLVYIHNHPSLSTFSLADLYTFMVVPQINTITIVTNQGKVFTLTKLEEYNSNKVKNVVLEVFYAFGMDPNEGTTDETDALIMKALLKRMKELKIHYGK